MKNTLSKLRSAEQQFLDLAGVQYLVQKLKGLFVEKREGYDLSQEDFTTEDADKLDALRIYETVGVYAGTDINADVAAGTLLPSTRAEGSTGKSTLYASTVIASANRFGVIKVGEGLSITDQGVLSADKQGIDEIPIASSSTVGGVKVIATLSDNDISGNNPDLVWQFMAITKDGVAYSAYPKKATTEKPGIVIVGSGLNVSTNGTLSVDDSIYAKKSDIVNVYIYKGSVATVSDLPATDNVIGDVWNVESSGMNYAWDGAKWDALGSVLEITPITNAEIDSILEAL